MAETILDQVLIIAAAAGAVISLFAALLLKKSELFINYILRFSMGVTAIYFINTVITMNGLESGVGLNGITILASSLLGLPGVFMMYGISIYLHGGL